MPTSGCGRPGEADDDSTAAGPNRSTTTATAVSADGTVIGYESIGAGPPVLLVHGSTGTRIRWSPVRASFEQHYTVHSMDRRGRGLSAVEAGPYSLRREAEDVAAVAQAVGGDVYVVGHSYGALAVLEVALLTTAFRRVVLYEPPLPLPGVDIVSPDGRARLKTMSDPREILSTFSTVAAQISETTIVALQGQGHQAIDYDSLQFVRAVVDFDPR
jgi:pimeloyl-ACP methyl ester carboxylesterase